MYPNRRRGPPSGNPPPPGPFQSSTPTWGEHIGSIHMSQPQNNVNAPGGIGTVVNVNVSGNGENIPATDTRHEDIHDLTRATKADHKIYSNQLLTKERGYPLWVPGPGMQLPIEYRRQGISIGDVGIITSTGEFDFLFNILQPPEHAINGGLVPQGFSPIPRQELERDIQETIVYGPNTYLASSSVRKTSMKWISETSIDQRFESAAKEAAILIMPDGATTQNLLNTWGVRDIILSKAKDWYTYTRTTRGRYVNNGDIRVVVGVDKVSSWGIATSACDSGQTASYVFKNDPTHTYQWDCIGGSGRVGPQKREIRDLIEDNHAPENQCVFVRTINFTFSGKMWNVFPSEGVQQRSGPGPWSGKSGRQDSASNNRRGPRGGHSTSGSGGTTSGNQPGAMQGLHCDLSVKFEPVELNVHHPSAALHDALHAKFPDAKMVITEDMDWISVLNDDDVVFPKPEDLCERILKVHGLQNHQGIVQIVRKDDPWWPSSSTNLVKDEDVLQRAISSAIGKVRTSQAKRSERLRAPTYTAPRPAPPKKALHRIGRGLHPVDRKPTLHRVGRGLHPVDRKPTLHRIGRGLHPADAPSTSPVKFPSLKRSYALFTPTSRETNMAPDPVASSHSAQDDSGKCPVCLKPLSFSVRLPGEKPHLVPECGHAVHEACFTAVYGPLPLKSNPGVCGECRRPMKVADGKSNKLAVLTNMGDSHSSSLFPGRDTPVARNRAAVERHDPSDDDVLEYNSTKSAQSEDGQYIVTPSIHVRPEFSHLTRTNDTNQPVTCVVVIELPGRVPGNLPGPVIPENYGKPRSQHSSSGPSNVPRYRKNQLEECFQNQRQLSDTHYASTSNGPGAHDVNPNTVIYSEDDSPFHAITEDLRNRIIDWKGHPLSDIGPLQMYDLFYVRGESALREFYVYLFKEAIICVVEEKKHGLSISSQATSSKGVLRLKEIIYVRRIKNVIASSTAGEMSLTIDTEDELASFVLIFEDRASLESWKNNIQALVGLHHAQNRGCSQNKLAPLEEDDELSNHDESPTTPRTSSGSSYFLDPLPHLQMDLILVISVPPLDSLPSTSQLKIIKTMLHFLVASLGPKDRLSVVTFEVGMGGNVRKTPFLMMGRPHSRVRLEKFIDETGVKLDESEDEFLVIESKKEKTDVVTAVNHGLDVVLQRKERNPVSGLILISDASDDIRRAQMDLVLARAESANVPIHSFGCSRSHNPASLWPMSRNTSGTYTFVKDWYDLRDCVAGCVGGMMSIGLLNMKLHLKVVDNYRFKIRKVSGGSQFILSDDGQSLEMDVGELRYGEKKEMLVELEVDNSDQQRHAQRRGGRHLDAHTIDEGPDLVPGMMIEEVPVLEVDGSFFDPAAAKNISRLVHPVLLTTTFLPGLPNSQKPPSDPVIVRRRMELLASDMITRALVLVSKRNLSQAQKILAETKHILHTVLGTISPSLDPHSSGSGSKNRKELMLAAVKAMQAILEDLQLLSEALEDDVELFAHDQRNFGAQQAMILKNQKSWSGRSATECLFWTTDNSIELVSRSADWIVDIATLALPESPTLGSAWQSSVRL